MLVSLTGICLLVVTFPWWSLGCQDNADDHLQLWSFIGDGNSFLGDKKAFHDFVDLYRCLGRFLWWQCGCFSDMAADVMSAQEPCVPEIPQNTSRRFSRYSRDQLHPCIASLLLLSHTDCVMLRALAKLWQCVSDKAPHAASTQTSLSFPTMASTGLPGTSDTLPTENTHQCPARSTRSLTLPVAFA